MTLPDGRTLTWQEFGEPAGQPVLLFHGTPGSRLWMEGDDPVARELGLRLIAPDRPGCGGSTDQPGRTLRDWSKDVSDLADHLGLGRFGVLGVSGGGMYAASTAHDLADRVAAAVLVASPCPLDATEAMQGMSFGNRLGFELMRRLPRLTRVLAGWSYRDLARMVRDDHGRYVGMIEARVCDADRALLRHPATRRTLVREQREGLRQGSRGALRDGELLASDWGFELGDIRTPVHVWHGEQDRLAPVVMGRHLASRIPGAVGHFLPGAGHLLTDDATCWRAMLEALARALAPPG